MHRDEWIGQKDTLDTAASIGMVKTTPPLPLFAPVQRVVDDFMTFLNIGNRSSKVTKSHPKS